MFFVCPRLRFVKCLKKRFYLSLLLSFVSFLLRSDKICDWFHPNRHFTNGSVRTDTEATAAAAAATASSFHLPPDPVLKPIASNKLSIIQTASFRLYWMEMYNNKKYWRRCQFSSPIANGFFYDDCKSVCFCFALERRRLQRFIDCIRPIIPNRWINNTCQIARDCLTSVSHLKQSDVYAIHWNLIQCFHLWNWGKGKK